MHNIQNLNFQFNGSPVNVLILPLLLPCQLPPPPSGDYDALLVLMLLPRLTFKADMLKDQLRQQHKLDEALGSLSTLTPQQADQLTFVLALVYKLSTLQLLVARATR